MKTGCWTDGYTDNDIRSNTDKSNLSVSNIKLYMFDHQEFDPTFRKNIPELIKWTEDNFVFRCEPGELASQWSANLLGEQDTVLIKMHYQTDRYAAECARWHANYGGFPVDTYVNGGILAIVAGELAKAAFQHGY